MPKSTFLILFVFFLISCKQANQLKQFENDGTQLKEVIISNPSNPLTGKIENLEIEYTVWGCDCPNWIQSKDNLNPDSKENDLKLHFYIEPAADSLKIPLYFDPFRHRLNITGQFYVREDVPQGIVAREETMPKAKVFRYSKMDVIDNPHFKPKSKVETLTLIYNGISCTCAQWSETKYTYDDDNKVYYWLEPAHEKLLIADKLFNGVDLPVIIKVKGQLVSENGFPKRRLEKVGKDAAGKVFRYTSIEVIQNGQKKDMKF